MTNVFHPIHWTVFKASEGLARISLNDLQAKRQSYWKSYDGLIETFNLKVNWGPRWKLSRDFVESHLEISLKVNRGSRWKSTGDLVESQRRISMKVNWWSRWKSTEDLVESHQRFSVDYLPYLDDFGWLSAIIEQMLASSHSIPLGITCWMLKNLKIASLRHLCKNDLSLFFGFQFLTFGF